MLHLRALGAPALGEAPRPPPPRHLLSRTSACDAARAASAKSGDMPVIHQPRPGKNGHAIKVDLGGSDWAAVDRLFRLPRFDSNDVVCALSSSPARGPTPSPRWPSGGRNGQPRAVDPHGLCWRQLLPSES
jgi:hypothetical protein